VTHPQTAYTIEGEVRDERTLAPVPLADVVVETDRPGYAARGRSDAGGRFAIGYSAALLIRRGGCVDPGIELCPYADADLVKNVSVRAEAGGRCSRVYRFTLEEVPTTGLLVLVGDCGPRRDR
jgi:hypothetical protein